jgi:hypothetical protein
MGYKIYRTQPERSRYATAGHPAAVSLLLDISKGHYLSSNSERTPSFYGGRESCKLCRIFTLIVDTARFYALPPNAEMSEAARPPSIGQFPTPLPSRRTTFGDTWVRGDRVATRSPSEVLSNQRIMPDRDNGGVVLPAVVRNREPKATNEPACDARRWESSAFTPRRMSRTHLGRRPLLGQLPLPNSALFEGRGL